MKTKREDMQESELVYKGLHRDLATIMNENTNDIHVHMYMYMYSY